MLMAFALAKLAITMLSVLSDCQGVAEWFLGCCYVFNCLFSKVNDCMLFFMVKLSVFVLCLNLCLWFFVKTLSFKIQEFGMWLSQKVIEQLEQNCRFLLCWKTQVSCEIWVQYLWVRWDVVILSPKDDQRLIHSIYAPEN